MLSFGPMFEFYELDIGSGASVDLLDRLLLRDTMCVVYAMAW